jgi:hypothetical protein
MKGNSKFIVPLDTNYCPLASIGLLTPKLKKWSWFNARVHFRLIQENVSSTDPHFDVQGQGRLGDGDAIITLSTITPKSLWFYVWYLEITLAFLFLLAIVLSPWWFKLCRGVLWNPECHIIYKWPEYLLLGYCVHDKSYSRNASSALNLWTTFALGNVNFKHKYINFFSYLEYYLAHYALNQDHFFNFGVNMNNWSYLFHWLLAIVLSPWWFKLCRGVLWNPECHIIYKWPERLGDGDAIITLSTITPKSLWFYVWYLEITLA